MNQNRMAAQYEIIYRAGVGNDDHEDFGGNALSRTSSAPVFMGYGTRQLRNKSSLS
jgi:hypothetical protein